MGSRRKRATPRNRIDSGWRSEAHVDIDRVSYAPEFRRLSGVTQVVPPQDDYHFHDRLSHSIKVAQVAASLARQLLQTRPDGFPGGGRLKKWVDPDHCYCAGLAHDIGHPPFGHSGEKAIQLLLEDRRPRREREARLKELLDPNGSTANLTSNTAAPATVRSFEGNAQSTRIVAALSFRKDADLHGLSLTRRSLAAIAKYPWLRGGHPSSITKLEGKWSFYSSESEVLEKLEKENFILTQRDVDGVVQRVHRWVEAEIMDWADDITYAVHDLEDFFRAGMLPLERVAAALRQKSAWQEPDAPDFDRVVRQADPEVALCLRATVTKLASTRDQNDGLLDPITSNPWEAIRNNLVDHMPTAPFDGGRDAHTRLQSFSSRLIEYLTRAASLRYDSGTKRIQLQIDPTAVLVAEFFKSLNRFFVIESPELATMQAGQTTNLESLYLGLKRLAEGWLAESSGKEHRQLPARLREYLSDPPSVEVDSDEWDEWVANSVVDYICGLRDVQALELAEQLRGSRRVLKLSGRWLNS